MEIKPSSHIIRWNLGLLYIRQNKHHLTLNIFIEAAELDPNEPEYFIKVAECYYEKQNHLQEIKVASNRALGYVQFAKFLCQRNELEVANTYFEQACKLNYKYWKSMYQISMYFRDYGNDYEKSQRYYLKTLEKKNRGNIYGSYGYLFARKCFDISLSTNDLKPANGGRRYFYYGLFEYEMGNLQRIGKKSFIHLILLGVDEKAKFKEYRIHREMSTNIKVDATLCHRR